MSGKHRSRRDDKGSNLHKKGLIILTAIIILSWGTKAQEGSNLADDHFEIKFNTTGITSLKRTNDTYDTDYIRAGGFLGNIVIRYRMANGKWQETAASGMPDRRVGEWHAGENSSEYKISYFDRYYLYHGDFNDHYADLELTLRYRQEGGALFWTIHLRNLSGKALKIGDVLIPLPFNTQVRWTKTEMYTRRLIPHEFVSGHGSFAFWMRPNGVGPYLVMTPLQECPAFASEQSFKATKLEYFDKRGVYIHSTVSGEEAREMGGTWRQPHSSLRLGPSSSSDSEVTYGFKFRWADGYDGVRDILYEERLFDVHVVPGMTVPEDLEAMFSLRTHNTIQSISPEFPEQTELEYLGEKGKDTHIYRARFSRLGENLLTVNYGDGKRMYLEFFVTEPLETLIKKRAAHLVARQQHRDASKWYNGLFSDWDMRNSVLRSPDDTDGLKQFWVACDDPGNCKAPFVAAKNVHFPDQTEIEAVEYYIKNYVWGGLQRTDKEKYAYGVYGIPNWKVNRESKPSERHGWVGHLWRLADYPHVIMLYLNMYRVAKHYPEMTKYMDAKAYFTVPYQTGGWSTYVLPRMNEMVIAPLIARLDREGQKDSAEWLKKAWEKKIAHYVNDEPNLLHAEYPGNPCAFESTQAFARYAVNQSKRSGTTLDVSHEDALRFMEEQIRINISLRGWIEPAYHLLGSSRPGTMFYMSQMGGWSLIDYSLYYSNEPEKYLRLGYASFLCNWALMNTGRPESDYGYWYPGKENDGGAGGGFVSQAIGQKQGKVSARGTWYYGGEAEMGFGAAMRTAATIVVEDPLFGLTAFGGRLSTTREKIEVIPGDGLRKRFHILLDGKRLHIQLDRDGFSASKPVVFDRGLGNIRLFLDNRTRDVHITEIQLSGLPTGTYRVFWDGKSLSSFIVKTGEKNFLKLAWEKMDETLLEIKSVEE